MAIEVLRSRVTLPTAFLRACVFLVQTFAAPLPLSLSTAKITPSVLIIFAADTAFLFHIVAFPLGLPTSLIDHFMLRAFGGR